ncbi:MAG: TonB-dependent receptor [Thermodesulfobacteriota bacterium]|nr:TonB-dependent receptor [Thermodesulfobacteriota bacterium]
MMKNFLFKITLILFCFFMTILCGTTHAQSEEERSLLELYYKDKDLVVTPTRHPKPISQVSENMTIITAEDIERMNAHTVAEVLNRVTGVFVNFSQDFGAPSLIYVQGSEQHHVLVLVDGIPWNFLNSGSAEINTIPIGIIDRIEVIKGPASSTWGSSLGGVVNIITKRAGNTTMPTGTVHASYGEEDTQDYRAEVSGSGGPVGYYLYTGYQSSDGLRPSRDFDNNSLYSKFHIPLSRDMSIGLSMGCSGPEIGFGDFPSEDISSRGDVRTSFGALSFDTSLTRDINFNMSFYAFQQEFVQMNHALGLGIVGETGELYLDNEYDEETVGARCKFTWEQGIHTTVLGVDFDRGELDQTNTAGTYLQSLGAPETTRTHPDIKRWAFYVNDTITWHRWSIIPGIRYDYDSVTGSFVSPSVGITYKLGKDSIVRSSVARGFTAPPLSFTSGRGLFFDENPNLEPEKIWSFQTGMESGIFRHVWLKATVFRHEVEDTIVVELSEEESLSSNYIFINGGETRRHGIELEAETVPYHNVTFGAGFAYVDLDPSNENGSEEIYEYNVYLRYNDKKSFSAELYGHFIWWDLDESLNAEYDDFIWDFNLNKRVYNTEMTKTELFFTIHNIFNGLQYLYEENKNPERWMELGIRFHF